MYMKKIVILLLLLSVYFSAFSQEFNKYLSEARSSYSSKNLSSSRFAMEQMLRDLDIAIGKEILKILPAKMDALSTIAKEDNVTGSSGAGTGLFVHRTYGTAQKSAKLDIINNSPLITSLNTILAMPFVGLGSSKDDAQKVVKVQGYKSVLNKNANADTGKTNFELQIPLNNTLVTFTLDDTTEADILRLAGTIPLAKIAEMAQ
jgi:hypothetical protein